VAGNRARGERFRRDVLAAMPDIEAMELVERFFAIGAKVVGSPSPVAIFLAGCRECLPEWEIQVAGCPRARADHDRDPEDSDAEFAHVGKIACWPHVEATDVNRPESARECAPEARGARPPGRKLGRVGVPSGAGARAGRLALSGLPRAAPVGRPPRG